MALGMLHICPSLFKTLCTQNPLPLARARIKLHPFFGIFDGSFRISEMMSESFRAYDDSGESPTFMNLNDSRSSRSSLSPSAPQTIDALWIQDPST